MKKLLVLFFVLTISARVLSDWNPWGGYEVIDDFSGTVAITNDSFIQVSVQDTLWRTGGGLWHR